jgi:hypothetical protein
MPGSGSFRNALRVWEAMAAEAVPIGALRGRDAYLRGMVPVSCLGVWVGSFVNFVRAQGLASTSQYHETKGHLIAMNCIAQLRRGAGFTPSAWALLQRPTEALWERNIAKLSRAWRTREREIRDAHEAALVEFLRHPPAGELRQVVQAAGARNGSELVSFLAALPVARQRALGLPCLGFHAVGGRHTCGLYDDDQVLVELEQGISALP